MLINWREIGMTMTEQLNLTWLAHAMTESPDSHSHYYYDSKNNSFFNVKIPAGYDGAISFYDIAGLELSQDDYHELFMRLANLSDPVHEIMEIGKLTAMQKRDIQWQFLSRFCGHKYHFDYFVAVIEQPEDERFVLDRLFAGEESARLRAVWEKFKLEMIHIYAINFARTSGIELNLMA